jgi:low affinity Fe/Cu permease
LASSAVGTYIVSFTALALTGVVLIQNARDTAAMQAKLNELIVAVSAARNEVVGLEHGSAEEIRKRADDIEERARATKRKSNGRALT